MNLAEQLFPDDATYLLVGHNNNLVSAVCISRITPELFLLEHRGRCICVSEAWIERVGERGLDRKAFALRRFARRERRYTRNTCWADKPGAFSGNAKVTKTHPSWCLPLVHDRETD